MRIILVVDNSPRDAERLASLFEEDDELRVELTSNGADAESKIVSGSAEIAAVVILLEIPGPPFAFELLLLCRRVMPGRPVVVISSALDAKLATRASALGARDFLEKPLDLERVRSCLRSLLSDEDPDLPVVTGLSETIVGRSSSLRATLKQVAKVVPHPATRVLLVGESGTGKELLAQGIHRFGPHSKAPCVAVNVGAIPRDLIENELFGHEKGAFTTAIDVHKGYLEEAGTGTLFLDEIGDLDLSLQVKLLRVIQERKFRRLKGTKDLDFPARLITATNRDLAEGVRHGTFRRDLFHRIAEVVITVPPLRERKGDLDLLLDYFLASLSSGRSIRFARETLTILRSYHFPGNIRELENLVRAALIDCDGDWILPHHLPLHSMGVFLEQDNQRSTKTDNQDAIHESADDRSLSSSEAADKSLQGLFREIERSLPTNWLELPYKKVLDHLERAFDRTYLPRLIERYRHNLTRATKAAGIDKKTFDRHWKEAGLSPMRAEAGELDDGDEPTDPNRRR